MVHVTKRPWLSGACMLALAVVATASAEPKVSRLRVATSESAAETVKIIPLGTEQIYVMFDYDGLANQQIGVKVVSPSGLELFSRSERLSGKGSKSLAVSGADVYRKLADLVVTSLVQVQTNAGLVSTQQAGQKEYLNQALANILTAKSVVSTLNKLPLGDSLRSERASLDRGLAELETTTDEARKLAADKVAEMKSAGDQIKRQAEGLVATAKAVQDAAKTATKVALPESGVDARTTYVAQVEINSDPADSVEFQVSNDKPLPPTVEPTNPPRTQTSAGAQPTQAAGATRPPATNAAGSGASATGNSALSPVATAAVGTGATVVAGASGASTAVAMTRAGTPAAGEAGAPAQTGANYPGPTADPDLAAGGVAQPTWTAMPGAQTASRGNPGSEAALPSNATSQGAPSGGAGTNLGILIAGVLVLAGAAFWLRRRGA